MDQLPPEAPADHAIEQEVGGGVEVLQHVGQVSSHIDGNVVVVPVEVLLIVLCPQDAVCDKAGQAEHNKSHRNSAQ